MNASTHPEVGSAEVGSEIGATERARALICAAHRLHDLWAATTDRGARADIAVAATLTAHAALDALLPDQSRGRRVRDSWRDGSVLVRAARITARLDEPLPDDLEILCAARHSLGRSGGAAALPGVRHWLETDGVTRAVRLVDLFDDLCGRVLDRGAA